MRIAITVGSLAGQTFVFPYQQEVTIGREAGCDLVLTDKGISRKHMRVRLGPPISVEDLASRNGSFVNNKRVEGTVTISPADTVAVGAARFRVDLGLVDGVPGGSDDLSEETDTGIAAIGMGMSESSRSHPIPPSSTTMPTYGVPGGGGGAPTPVPHGPVSAPSPLPGGSLPSPPEAAMRPATVADGIPPGPPPPRQAGTPIPADAPAPAPAPGPAADGAGRRPSRRTDKFEREQLLSFTFCAKCGGTISVQGKREGVAYLCEPCRLELARDATKVGRYAALAQVGEGATARVYRAVDDQGKLAALKVYFLQPGAEERKLQRIIREVHTTAKLKHPNIVRMIEAGRAGNTLYVALEYVEGTDLASEVERLGVLEPRVVIEIGAQVAEALGYAHEAGIIHRDLKPGNLLLNAQGQAKVTDFGLAKVMDDATTGGLTYSGAMLGTAGYMPPEQVGSAKRADVRSDVYGLGATMFHLLTGRPPFHGTAAEVLGGLLSNAPVTCPIEVNPALPSIVDLVIRRSLEKDPARRYQSAHEFAQVLRQILPLVGSAVG